MSKQMAILLLCCLGCSVIMVTTSYADQPATKKLPRSSQAVLSLENCQQLAAKNNGSLKLTIDEMKVAKSKVWAAGRKLWPEVNVKGEATRGAALKTLGTPGFLEQSYGVQLTHILYHGGRLWNTLAQAKTYEQTIAKKYRQQQLELVYQVTEAYWNLVRAQSSIQTYRQIKNKLSTYHNQAKQLKHQGMISQKIFLTAKSYYQQIDYQIHSAEAELDKFIWQWTEVLGLDTPPKELPRAQLPYKKITLVLAELEELASVHHPDIQVQKLQFKNSQLEKNIKNSYRYPKLELTGFYGRSGGAYDSEQLELREDYNISIKLTQDISWNSLNLSGFDQKTSPKLGQSSRTESRTATASFSFLDGYERAAGKEEAEWQLSKEEFKLKQTKRQVIAKVREAYFNYQQASHQVNQAELDLDLNRRELEIARINLKANKTSLADVAERVYRLAGSQVSYQEAKAFYLIAIAAVNRAIGLPEKYQLSKEVGPTNARSHTNLITAEKTTTRLPQGGK